jgi:uncharacterized protein YgiM (DUF1202 family)
MNRIHRILRRAAGMTLAVSLMFSCCTFSASANQPGSVIGNGVRLRSEPSTEGRELDVLNQGDELEILDSSTDGWLKVSCIGDDGDVIVGYLSRDFVSIGSAIPTAAVNSAGITQTATITGGGVRLRSEPSTDDSVLTLIADGEIVSIVDESIEGWVQVTYSGSEGNFTGYIASEYLFVNPMATGVAARSSVILREEPNNSSAILSILQADTQMDILDSVDDWYQVNCGDLSGYVLKSLVTTENDSGCIGYGTITADSLYLRSEPNGEASVLTSLPNGVTFQITSDETEGWYGAIFNGQSGYVSADYVEFSDSISTGYIQVTASSLSLRAGAGTAFAKLTSIPEGTVLTVSGSYGSWYQVTFGNYTGYVSGAYVSATTAEGYQHYPDFAQITATSLTLRKSPSTDAESLATIATGVVVAVSDKTAGWYKVSYDGKVGYIDASYTVVSNGPATVISHTTSSTGSTSSNRTSTSAGHSSNYSGGTTVSGGSGSAVADYACQFLGNPYVWGGTSLTNGVDCSGFVMQVYAHFGYSLPHSSSAQRSYGKEVSLENIQPGDIVCYNHHVGIYVGNGKIISALGKNYGIVYSSVTYKSIITIRRIFS